MNIFMQFIYSFLFLVYLAIIPEESSWATALIWVMMILPLADALMNCLQNLTSRIAGVDNEQMSNRVVGIGAMLGFGLGAIKEQFRSPMSTVSNEENKSTVGLKGFFSRAKSIISPNSMNLTSEKDYNGNTNPIRNVLPKETVNTPNTNITSANNTTANVRHIAGKVISTSAKATKAYLGMGASLAEGDFSRYSYRKNNKQNEIRNDYKNIEYMNKLNNSTNSEKLGDEYEPK